MTPRAKLHVDGAIRCGQSSFVMNSLENLTVVRGGFSCRTLEPKRGPGWQLHDFKNGMLEVRFIHPFTKRPSIIAVQNVPQQSPSLIPIGYVDSSKFGFLAAFSKSEVCIHVLFVFGLFNILIVFYLISNIRFGLSFSCLDREQLDGYNYIINVLKGVKVNYFFNIF